LALNIAPEQRTSIQYAALGRVKLVVEGATVTFGGELEAAIAKIVAHRVGPSRTRQLYARLAAEYDARPRAARSSAGLSGEVNPI